MNTYSQNAYIGTKNVIDQHTTCYLFVKHVIIYMTIFRMQLFLKFIEKNN